MRANDTSATNTTKPVGYILWSQRREVSSKQEAWHDRTTYEVPFVGAADFNRICRALYNKCDHRGPIIGSSYGAASVSNVIVDANAKTIKFDISVGIGD